MIDGLAVHTGDDIAIIMSHRRGVGAASVHRFARECVDVFGNVARDPTRLKDPAKADEWRHQRFTGPTVAPRAEMSHNGIVETLALLDRDFELRHENGAGASALGPVGRGPVRHPEGS